MKDDKKPMHPLAKEFHDGCQGATPEEIEKARQWYVLFRLKQLVDETPGGDWNSVDEIYHRMNDEGFPIGREELNRMLQFFLREGFIDGLGTRPLEGGGQ
jgi:hypothetical protein